MGGGTSKGSQNGKGRWSTKGRGWKVLQNIIEVVGNFDLVCDVYGKEGCIAHNYHYHKTIPSRGMFRNIVEENQKKKMRELLK